ncbi:unnamed protein product [Cyprideis torosa]|uniref:Uncharacterized protein n=1 Tax=Cyprideis torosa TaxID=163714 RepID=A0A7R8W0D2_9CRUS|nr:unnamed protein product [Cyprideis torosa]CAG0879421.1 unnamed protein product [Cyprideis torosa]
MYFTQSRYFRGMLINICNKLHRRSLWVICVLFVGVFLVLSSIMEQVQELHEALDRKSFSFAVGEQEVGNVPFSRDRPVVWIRGVPRSNSSGIETDILEHVHRVFQRLRYDRLVSEKVPTSKWSVLWAQTSPFFDLKEEMSDLKPHQRVNHWPGTGSLWKLTSGTSKFKFIPKIFRLPKQKEELFKHAQQHPEVLFVQRHNEGHEIQLKKVSEINVSDSEAFIQEFISDPLLIDGHKFDIGVYTYITSVDPLRIYVFDAIQFRFCTVKYHPFDAAIKDKYVVGKKYLPMNEVPSFKKGLNEQSLNNKQVFDAYVAANTGKDPQQLWQKVMAIIRTAIMATESEMIQSLLKFSTKRPHPFFELLRFDLTFDEHFEPYLMKANLSPNLSNDLFPRHQLLSERVLYTLLSLVGLARHLGPLEEEAAMEVSEEDIAVSPEACASPLCVVKRVRLPAIATHAVCSQNHCEFCIPCLSEEQKLILKAAYLEHENRKFARRIFPPSIPQPWNSSETVKLTNFEVSLLPLNRWMNRWFQGMCQKDETWCS